ncbi:MAG: transporter substrate-binding domain-containing protein [Desulfobacterales bacterium]|nr:transporter substrate-binding domain-containing protein [Desulfobacterales bacterium]
MKRFIKAVFLVSLFAINFGILSSTVFAGDKLVLATTNWEPYVGEKMMDGGYVAVVVKEAFKRGGMDAEFKFHQWSRVVGLAKAGKVDGYFPEYYADSVKAYAAFSNPMPGGPLGFYKQKGADINFNGLESLKGKKIGVVTGYVNTEEFDNASFLTKDASKDDLTNLKKLVAGRIDLMVSDKFVGKYLAQTNMPDKVDSIEFMSPSLAELDLFVCVPNKSGKQSAILEAFNTGIKQMKEDGTLKKILADFGF